MLNGFGNKYPGIQNSGDHGTVLPGGGELPAQVVKEVSGEESQPNKVTSLEDRSDTDQTRFYKFHALYERKEADIDMKEILISFWHGVAAVLIGETCALAMATAWLRMKMRSEK